MSGHMFSLDESMLEGIKSIRICRPAPHLPVTNASISLETVASYVLELEVELGDRHYSSITLREVPLFLLEAFRDLRSRGMDVEGLFRKEGNWNRLKNVSPVYFGCMGIPGECTVHDICSMIKRFFREIKTPLFAHLESSLINIASDWQGEQRRLRLLDTVLMLPASHLGTLAYLLRQLKYFGDHHEGHHMTIENLSRVFAPTLFREGSLHIGNKKKKKNVQKPIYSVMRNDTELKIMIINELIENAAKVGVPRDFYVFSRRPSDLNFNKGQARRAGLQNNSSLRSSSAKPFTRNSITKPNAFICGDVKDKKDEKLKYKNREGRRSSSTVREIFSSISSISTKVLRRAASPSRMLSRRTSGDVAANGNLEGKRHGIGIAKGNSEKTFVDSIERKSELNFDNEEKEQSKAVTFDNEEDHCNEKSRKEMTKAKAVPVLGIDTSSASTLSQRRSRRESPRKHLTTNSRVKPVSDPLIGINWWPASPAFESPQISVKHLNEIIQKRRGSLEMNEKLQDNKLFLQKPSRTNKEALDANHIALSFLENYDKDQQGCERRRRHTAPLKFTSILKRNQPNTIGTGLKNVQVRVRDRRAVTLSFRSTNGGPSRRFDKMKRRSESLGGESSDRSQISGDENTAVSSTHFIDASDLLEQKNNECRQRRAKRKKRKEKTSDSDEGKLFVKTCESPISLLDDVTNALERLERERQSKFEDESRCLDLTDSQPSTSIKSASDATSLNHSQLGIAPSSGKEMEEIKEVPNVQNSSTWSSQSPAHKSTKNNLSYRPSEMVKKEVKSKHIVNYENSFKIPFSKARLSSQSNNKDVRFRSTTTVTNEEINDEAFAFSDVYKKQILTLKKDDSTVAKQYCGTARPSVAFIKNNNRGMVKQRVNQFAQLESQNLVESFCSKSSQNSQSSLCISGPYEFMKPSAPPVTHGLRPAERRLTASPPSNCSSVSRMKISDISSTNSSPRFSPQSITLKSCSPVLRAASSTPLKPTQGSNLSSSSSTMFTPLIRRRTKH